MLLDNVTIDGCLSAQIWQKCFFGSDEENHANVFEHPLVLCPGLSYGISLFSVGQTRQDHYYYFNSVIFLFWERYHFYFFQRCFAIKPDKLFSKFCLMWNVLERKKEGSNRNNDISHHSFIAASSSGRNDGCISAWMNEFCGVPGLIDGVCAILGCAAHLWVHWLHHHCKCTD